jgi:hypothetical protein
MTSSSNFVSEVLLSWSGEQSINKWKRKENGKQIKISRRARFILLTIIKQTHIGTCQVRSVSNAVRYYCYQYVRLPQLLKPCASIAVQLLYAIRILIHNTYVNDSNKPYFPSPFILFSMFQPAIPVPCYKDKPTTSPVHNCYSHSNCIHLVLWAVPKLKMIYKTISVSRLNPQIPACCSFIGVYVDRVLLHRRTVPLCVFFTLSVFALYKLTSTAQIKTWYVQSLLLYSIHCCS